MTAYEIWYDLLIELMFAVYLVEYFAKFAKLCEGWLAHQSQHIVVGMLGGYFQSSAYMVFYKFLGVFCCFVVLLCVAGFM